MNDWRNTAKSSIYQETLKATQTIEEPSYGFLKPADVTKIASTAIIKQNNTIIQLLVKIKEDLEDCKIAIRRLEAAKTKIPETEDLTQSISDLQKGLQKLSLGEPSEKKIKRTTGHFFVFKNPKEIFESVKNQK
jgi:hypothetical protein